MQPTYNNFVLGQKINRKTARNSLPGGGIPSRTEETPLLEESKMGLGKVFEVG